MKWHARVGAGLVFTLHILVSHVAVIFLGLSVLQNGVLPTWEGWLGVGLGAVITIGHMAMNGGPFAPPILVHVWPLVAGITILTRV